MRDLRFVELLWRELRETVRNPRRICKIFNRKILYGYIIQIMVELKYGWEKVWGFEVRDFGDYQTYLRHQKKKLGLIDLREYEEKYQAVLLDRLTKLNMIKPGMSALCLGARLGAEVRAFIDLGCFAIGIDLNPGPENKYVLYGDFHHTQYADNSIDIIFTNCIDHTHNIDNLIHEIKRILKPNGLLIIEAMQGRNEGGHTSIYESFYWPTINNLCELFTNRGMKELHREKITYPWQGEIIIYRENSH